MPIRLIIAPAGAGKTQACLTEIARLRRTEPLAPVWVCLPNRQQLDAFRGRLAAQGGSLGINLGTFHELYQTILDEARRPYTRLDEPVQLALVRELAAVVPLDHYRAIAEFPGFHRRALQLIRELKQGGIEPQDLGRQVRGRGARLEELARLYQAYQDRLHRLDMADVEGLGWLAREALDEDEALLGDLRLLAVDGFDQFNPIQQDVLQRLGRRVGELWITLTGDVARPERPAHRRFRRARRALEHKLDVTAEPLPVRQGTGLPQGVQVLEASLFEPGAGPHSSAAGVTLLEAASPLEEVRAALRWIKGLLAREGLRPQDCAVIGRELSLYRPFLLQTAREFGLPLRLESGFRLAENAVVAAVMQLLALPVGSEDGGGYGRRELLDAWRSPYFRLDRLGVQPHDAERLEAAARWGQVTGGLGQWRETLRRLAARQPEADPEEGEEPGWPPVGREAQRLLQRLERLVDLLRPRGRSTRERVAWLERLIGADPALVRDEFAPPDEEGSLEVVRQVRRLVEEDEDPPQLAEELVGRDIEALRAFKDVLRGLVLSEEIVGGGSASYPDFLGRLRQAVERAEYSPPRRTQRAAILAAEAERVRGARFAAVAVLGLAEGVFPGYRPEDPLLRDEDRQALAGRLAVELRPRDEEATHFYEAVTRADRALFLSRPYLTETGERWEPSPYWEHLRGLLQAPVERAGQRHLPALEEAGSWPEALARAAREGRPVPAGHPRVADWEALETGRRVLSARLRARASGPFEGHAPGLGEHLRRRFVQGSPWSPSRLETYIGCGHHFFARYGLALEPRQPVRAGFDVAQLGSIFHAILEETYRPDGDPQQGVEEACEAILPGAPERFGFRRTALWEVQQEEIRRVVRASVEELQRFAGRQGRYEPRYLEVSFGFPEAAEPLPPLILEGEGGEPIAVRGIIDRLDQDAGGRVRLIDYKSGRSPSAEDVRRLRRVQLAVYALAAERVVGLPGPSHAFYWHVRPAQATPIRLDPEALAAVEGRVRQAVGGVLAGAFEPHPPSGGCPGWCPATAYCWRYAPNAWSR